MPRYNPAVVEPKWQQYWSEHRTFRCPDLPSGPKLYVLDMFPYPSGDGLHVGHPEGYTATDIVCRFERMRGKSVLHPMGFDSFGLPAEEHAIRTNTPPRESTERNIANFRRQLKMLGFSYDWDRELATTDVGYFRWTQWIFLELFDTWYDREQQRGRPIRELPIPAEVASQGADAVRRYQDEQRLAYQAEALVNWCPNLGTVLANEEVVDGVSERGGHPVQRIPLRQWMLRITEYADRLERDLDGLQWPEGIKKLQRDWIGRSTGAEVDFFLGDAAAFPAWRSARTRSGFPRKPTDDVLRIYTTRPDTLFGATYMVIAPEHPFVERLTTAEQRSAVQSYCTRAASKSDLDRTDLAKEKTGVFTGAYAINPVNGQPIPIWIADYVLISYGTGAIMAVPAHDDRDQEFARQFHLPIIAVVDPGPEHEDRQGVLEGRVCFTDYGTAVQSGAYDGTPTATFQERITADLATSGVGRRAVNYKLRDWLFSRQRFWGEPFPILHELDANGQPTGLIRAVPVSQLPVDLPHLEDYRPHGRPEPPLAKAPPEWLYVELEGRRYRRETNTMPQWAGSCWYFLRFIDPDNAQSFVDPEKERAWMPVDLYIGGAEHAVLHLLYARFWHKVLYDRGHVSTVEPFRRLVNQGMILGENNEKMSKSRGNVVNPDVIVRDYGADSLRLYEMFMGPLEASKPWSMASVNGVRSFLDRVWRLVVEDKVESLTLQEALHNGPPTDEELRSLHKTIKAVTRDLETLSFNTAIARMMEFVNFTTRQTARSKQVLEQFVLLLSPFAPHLAEELWSILGHDRSLAYEAWPQYDEALTQDALLEMPVQVNGKLRGKILVPPDASQETILAAAKADKNVSLWITGKHIVKELVVPSRLVNFVVKEATSN